MSAYPPGVTLTREADKPERPVVEAPRPLRHVGRLSSDEFSAGSTLVREYVYDDAGPVHDAHFTFRDRAREAAEITKAARDSILRPAHLADRGTNFD